MPIMMKLKDGTITSFATRSTSLPIYSNLDYKSKITSANVMDNVLALPDNKSHGW